MVGLVGLPSTVIPVGFAGGELPVGVQVVASAGCDFDGLAVARTLDAVSNAFRVPPLAV
jgi:amidase